MVTKSYSEVVADFFAPMIAKSGSPLNYDVSSSEVGFSKKL